MVKFTSESKVESIKSAVYHAVIRHTRITQHGGGSVRKRRKKRSRSLFEEGVEGETINVNGTVGRVQSEFGEKALCRGPFDYYAIVLENCEIEADDGEKFRMDALKAKCDKERYFRNFWREQEEYVEVWLEKAGLSTALRVLNSDFGLPKVYGDEIHVKELESGKDKYVAKAIPALLSQETIHSRGGKMKTKEKADVNCNQIKAYAKANDTSVTNLVALARRNDPFYFGTEGDREKAKWARKYWKEMGSPSGVHPRRIHYYIISLDNPTRYDGTPYKNTEKDWKHPTECLKAARYLGEIPFWAITDARNPEVEVHHPPAPDKKYDSWPVSLEDDLEIEKPHLGYTTLENLIDLKVSSLVDKQLQNTEYSSVGRQPYLCEIWVEKATMTDVLEPIATRYSANLQEAKGESSIRMAFNLVKRLKTLKDKGFKKPVRVFYISDFDPHGLNMPKSMARHLEFFIRKILDFDIDLKVKALALTESQCRKYELSRTPVSDERMLGDWKDKFGEGRTELDALEAQQPGLLKRTVEEALKEYYDPEMDKKVRQAEEKMREEIEEKIRGKVEEKEEELREAREDLGQALEEIKKKVEDWKDENEELIKKYKDLFKINPDLDDIEFEEPDPDVDPEEGSEWFFDSTLDYFDQLEKYKERWS